MWVENFGYTRTENWRTDWLIVFVIGMLSIQSCSDSKKSDAEMIAWELNDTTKVGSLVPEVLGAPEVLSDSIGNALSFDGRDDGLVIPANPVQGMKEFTVEVLFKPAADGAEEQRFVHFQDEADNRGLLEIRINPENRWSLDTFLYNSKSDEGLTLLDRSIEHPCDQWYWAALAYDGMTMKHFVNGKEELEGEIEFIPMVKGEISLGVRLNRVYWYKGMIKEIRFYPRALEAGELQRL